MAGRDHGPAGFSVWLAGGGVKGGTVYGATDEIGFRAMGLAARFVSGYAYPDDASRAELHAWGEVYLAGGGWRGYDPSRGLAVCDQHVTLAAAADPADAAPVSGTFRGDGVNSRLETELTMRAASMPSPPAMETG